MKRFLSGLVLATLLLTAPAIAQPRDPARDLIELADGEAELGKLEAARKHLVDAKAATSQDADLNGIAAARLAVLDKRMPRLTIRIAPDAPKSTVVLRNGLILNRGSLDAAVPVDPGTHVIVARVEGRAERSYEIELAEGESKEVDVAPGDPIATKPKPEGGPTLRTIGLGTTAVGVIGLGVGTVFGLMAHEKRDSTECANEACSAYSYTDFSRLFLVTGGIVTTAGAVMLFVAPSEKKTSPANTVQVSVGWDRVVVVGRF